MMRFFKNLSFIVASLAFCGFAHSSIVQVEQIQNGTAKQVSQPYIVTTNAVKVYVAAAVGESVRLTVVNPVDNTRQVLKKDMVSSSDDFSVGQTRHFGEVFSLSGLTEGSYQLIVERGDWEIASTIQQVTSNLVVEFNGPKITGGFFWDNSSGYWATHVDGIPIRSLTEVRSIGFSGVVPSISGNAKATFTSEFLDGPNVGQKHARELAATMTSDAKVMIGSGAMSSVSSAYLPSSTNAKMRLTYRVYSKAGLFAEKSEIVYLNNRATQSAPVPYGVFTGVSSSLDGVPAFTGFSPYVANMVLSSNPVRMLYKADKRHYFGGGGDADIYGGFLNSRDKNRLVHTDAQFVYFDIKGSTDGSKISESNFFVRDLTTWRRFSFLHQFQLTNAAKPPVANELAYFRDGLGQWVSAPKQLETYIIKDQVPAHKDLISKIRVRAEPRPYAQSFTYDFGGTKKGNCTIPIDETECIATANLEYPRDDIGVYHNRHRIIGVSNGRQSDELISIWYYDGAPAFIAPGSVIHDPINKTVGFKVNKNYVTAAWGRSLIRDVKLYVAHEDRPTERVALSLVTSDNTTTAGTENRNYIFRYDTLLEGKYSFYAYIEDGYPTTSDRYKRENQILQLSFLDMTPPVITTNIGSNPLHAVQDIKITLQDSSAVSVQSVSVSGGDSNINQALPFVFTKNNIYQLQFVYLKSSLTTPYNLSIEALDAAGNSSTIVVPFLYQPLEVAMADTKQPAIPSALRDDKGRPTNVITTPQIRDSDGNLAKGVHKVFFTLDDDAQSAMIVNGTNVSPGSTIAFSTNLSLTGNRLRFEAYPVNGNVPTENSFQIDIPELKVTVCPEDFSESGQHCIYLNLVPSTQNCPDGYSLNTDQKRCEKVVSYTPNTTCSAGYQFDSETNICIGKIKANPVQTCPTGYGMQQGVCQKHDVTSAEPCDAGSMLEDAMCKSLNGDLTSPSVYCGGHNVSSKPYCDNGICTTYNPTWNACETVTPAIPDSKCPTGTLSQGQCEFDHQYSLQVSCPFGFNREEFTCSRLEIIEPLKTCPTGWDKAAENCVKFTYEEFTDCPATHALINDRCHQLQAIQINCPSTYVWDGENCSRTQVENASEVCPADHAWNGTTCRKTESQTATANCDPGYLWDGSQCKLTLNNPATPVCDDGYTWDGTVCKKKETQPGTLKCGTGYTWNGTTCEKLDSINATLNCPSPYTWNNAKSTCEKGAVQSASAQCATGFALNAGGLCEKTDTSTPVKQCSSGFTFDGTNCTKTESQAAAKQCPTGYTLKADGSQCERIQTTSSTSQCPDGYTWNGSTCRSAYTTGVNPTGFTCPNNNYASSSPTAAFQNVCQSTQAVNCPSGYGNNPDDEARCYASNYTPSYGGPCPVSAPYKFVDNNYQCTTSPGQTWTVSGSCPVGYTYNSSYGCINNTKTPSIGWHCCEPGLTYNASTGKMDGYLDSSKVNSCPSGYSYQGSGVCSKTDIAAFSLSCAATWTLSGSNCIKMTAESPTDSCSSGWTLIGANCTKLTTQAPSSYSCPVGWTLDGTSCNGTETTSRIYTCASDRTLNGTKCEKTITQGRIWSCPTGWTGGSTCSITLKIPPSSYLCPADWILTAQTCSQDLLKAPLSHSCPTGWTQMQDPTACEKYTDTPIDGYVCKPGWDLQGNQCSVEQTTAETRSCDSGFTQHDQNRCHADSPSDSIGVCPGAEWKVEQSQCVLRDVLDFTLECSEGFELLSQQCHKSTSQDADIECGEGDKLVDGKCENLSTTPITTSCEAPYVAHSGQCRHRVEIRKIEDI